MLAQELLHERSELLQDDVAPELEATSTVEVAVDADTSQAYEYVRQDGTVERARSAKEAIEVCPVLGQLAIKDSAAANLLLDMATLGQRKMAERAVPKQPKPESPQQAEPLQTEKHLVHKQTPRTAEKDIMPVPLLAQETITMQRQQRTEREPESAGEAVAPALERLSVKEPATTIKPVTLQDVQAIRELTAPINEDIPVIPQISQTRAVDLIEPLVSHEALQLQKEIIAPPVHDHHRVAAMPATTEPVPRRSAPEATHDNLAMKSLTEHDQLIATPQINTEANSQTHDELAISRFEPATMASATLDMLPFSTDEPRSFVLPPEAEITTIDNKPQREPINSSAAIEMEDDAIFAAAEATIFATENLEVETVPLAQTMPAANNFTEAPVSPDEQVPAVLPNEEVILEPSAGAELLGAAPEEIISNFTKALHTVATERGEPTAPVEGNALVEADTQELTQPEFVVSRTIAATVSEKLSELEPDMQVEVAAILQELVTATTQIQELSEERINLAESTEATTALNESLVVELFEALGVEYANKDVQEFTSYILRFDTQQSKRALAVSNPDLEHDGTREAKIQPLQTAAVTPSIGDKLQQAIGMFAMHYMRPKSEPKDRHATSGPLLFGFSKAT